MRPSNHNLPSLPIELRKLFESNGHMKFFKKGEIVLRDNTNIRDIPIVLSGRLKVLRQESEGKELLLYYINPGETCIMSVFGGLYQEKSKILAVTEEDSELLMLPSHNVSEWFTKYPDWLNYILNLYHRRFEDLLIIVNQMAFQSMSERVLNWLSKKSEFAQTNEIKATHQEIADELSSSREVISRLLKQLESDGKIELHRNKILLK